MQEIALKILEFKNPKRKFALKNKVLVNFKTKKTRRTQGKEIPSESLRNSVVKSFGKYMNFHQVAFRV